MIYRATPLELLKKMFRLGRRVSAVVNMVGRRQMSGPSAQRAQLRHRVTACSHTTHYLSALCTAYRIGRAVREC